MPRGSSSCDSAKRFLLNRREFLQTTALVSGGISLSIGLGGCDDASQGQKLPWPRYLVRRGPDELFVEVVAVGFHEAHFFGRRFLKALDGYDSPHLIYKLPPQHYAEV